MTYAEIFAIEDANLEKIYLFREGTFLRAYERSAYLFHQYIKDFKLSYRFIKKENRYVVSLGFPAAVAKHWLYNYPVNELNEHVLVCDIARRVDEVDYQNWLDVARLARSTGEQYTVHTSVIEKQPVYKTAYDVLIQIMVLSVHVSKTFWHPYSNRSKELAYLIAYEVSRLYDVEDRGQQIDQIQQMCSELNFLMRILRDTHQISTNSFAFCSERIVSVSKQLEALRRKAKA